MKTLLTCIALILALGAAGVAGYGYYERTGEVKRLNDTIAELESRIAANKQMFDEFLKQGEKSTDTEAVPQAVEKDMASLREKVESVSTRVEVLGTQVSALRESDKKNKVQIARLEKNAATPSGAAVGGGTVRKEDIEDLIEEKMKGRQPLGKEPPLAAVAARLELEDVERKALEDILRQKKNQMMELLQTPRADGGNMLDDFADQIIEVMASGDEQEGKKVFMKFFQRLASDRVPGTDRTYFVDIVKMQQETREAFKTALPEQQFQAFEALGIENPMDIKIDNDPLGLYLQQRMQAQGVTPPGGGQ
jgi:hypothetical protein